MCSALLPTDAAQRVTDLVQIADHHVLQIELSFMTV
jgi:hypothetical protein